MIYNVFDRSEWYEKITGGKPQNIMKPIAKLTKNVTWSIAAFLNGWYSNVDGSSPKLVRFGLKILISILLMNERRYIKWKLPSLTE